MACQYLADLGYQIIERNWRYSKAEIDIIAKDQEVLVFIEVKTRSSDYFGKPEDFVSEHKELLYSDAASRYMESIGYEWEIRFDIISVLLNTRGIYTIEHFKDAWF